MGWKSDLIGVEKQVDGGEMETAGLQISVSLPDF